VMAGINALTSWLSDRLVSGLYKMCTIYPQMFFFSDQLKQENQGSYRMTQVFWTVAVDHRVCMTIAPPPLQKTASELW